MADVGIIENNLWYSHFPFSEGETVTLYTGVWNGGKERARGEVAFLANGVEVGRVPFAVNGGELTEVSTRWVSKSGSQSLKAKIVEAYLARDGQKEALALTNKESDAQVVLIERVIHQDKKDNLKPIVALASTTLATAVLPVVSRLPESVSDPVLAMVYAFDDMAEAKTKSLTDEKNNLKTELKKSTPENNREQSEDKGITSLEDVKEYFGSSLAATAGLKDPFTYAKYIGVAILLFFVSKPILLALVFSILAIVLARSVLRIARKRRYPHLT